MPLSIHHSQIDKILTIQSVQHLYIDGAKVPRVPGGFLASAYMVVGRKESILFSLDLTHHASPLASKTNVVYVPATSDVRCKLIIMLEEKDKVWLPIGAC